MTESFDDLNLTDNLLRGIYSYGFENPSPIQGKAIPIMNEKKDLRKVNLYLFFIKCILSFAIGSILNFFDIKLYFLNLIYSLANII